MPTAISPRLAKIVNALPLEPHMRVLEIGCGPGAAARAVAALLVTGHVVAIDRSATAMAQARTNSVAELASGRLSFLRVAIEEVTLDTGEPPFDLVFAIRVGALDGRIASVAPHGRLFIDGIVGDERIGARHQRQVVSQVRGGFGQFHRCQLVTRGMDP